MPRPDRVISYQPTSQTGNDRAAFGIALLLAAALHLLFLGLPESDKRPRVTDLPAHFRLRLTTIPPTAAPQVPADKGAASAEPVAGGAHGPADNAATPPSPLTAPGQVRKPASTSMQGALARQLLSRQYLREDPAAVPFSLARPDSGTHDTGRAFHFPAQANMLSMLDRPLPDLPFGYTPGLVRFAYDPGVRGDLQRFWDTITPEFGWTTRHGTEVRCIWVLVVVACGWK